MAEAMRPAVKDSRIWREMLADMAGRGMLAAEDNGEGREGKQEGSDDDDDGDVKKKKEMRKQEKVEGDDDDGGGNLLSFYLRPPARRC